MLWSDLKPALQSLMVTLTGLPDSNVVWRNKQRPAVVPTRPGGLPGAMLTMKATGVMTMGQDENRIDSDDTERVTGCREFRLELQCQSFTQDDDTHAITILETVRTLIRSSTSINTLALADVSLKELGTTQDLSDSIGEVDDRVFSWAALDIEFNGSSDIVNPTPVGLIESVTVSGDAGSELENAGPVTVTKP